jgi:hypothetical protein
LETCTANIQCLDSELTYCKSTHCTCTNSQYFSQSLRKCVPRVGELQSCFSDDMCLTDMICNTTNCLCQGFNFYENTSSICRPQLSNNQFCNRDLECRNDKGLACIGNRCVCSSIRYTWSTNASTCLLTYNQAFCVSDSDCNRNQNLKCVMESCNCPNTSAIGRCDCRRVLNNEEFWNGSSCTGAKSYGNICSYTYECQTITQNTICKGGFCVCSNDT